MNTLGKGAPQAPRPDRSEEAPRPRSKRRRRSPAVPAFADEVGGRHAELDAGKRLQAFQEPPAGRDVQHVIAHRTGARRRLASTASGRALRRHDGARSYAAAPGSSIHPTPALRWFPECGPPLCALRSEHRAGRPAAPTARRPMAARASRFARSPMASFNPWDSLTLNWSRTRSNLPDVIVMQRHAGAALPRGRRLGDGVGVVAGLRPEQGGVGPAGVSSAGRASVGRDLIGVDGENIA